MPTMSSARVRAHSVNPHTNTELITFELIYPRFIHSELMTHRLFSRNAPSSRAIPTPRQIEMVREDPAKPTEWGKNQKGMQSDEQLGDETRVRVPDEVIGKYTFFEYVPVSRAWQLAAESAASWGQAFYDAGLHKQMTNRLIENFTWMRTIVTATEFDNWFWLRRDSDAAPTIRHLANLMWREYTESDPTFLDANSMHVPFYNDSGIWRYKDEDIFGVKIDEHGFTASQALMVSSSCCAQVSFRKEDDSFDKARNIYGKLIESEPVHASPFEHQAWLPDSEYLFTPINASQNYHTMGMFLYTALNEPGITHVSLNSEGNDEDGGFDVWSGNFRNFIQHRQIIPGHTCWDYNVYLNDVVFD